ncbi:MAG: glycerate kinase [Aeromicrobium sp.]|nr:glycerate kinase [Aeromicrobium sp.]
MIAPDSFKGTASATIAAAAIARGWASVRQGDELVQLPMADGGEGTLDTFAAAVDGAKWMPARVTGPDDAPVDTEWLLLPDGTGVVELARASGLTLLDPLQPLDAHTLGFGQLIAAALDAGATRLILAIGGSSSTDGGAGALTALGVELQDVSGEQVPFGNRGLAALESARWEGARAAPEDVVVLCDVSNPLLGPTGAAAVFGPQKGAMPADIPTMDANLARLARVLGRDPQQPGAGAAGGTSFGLVAWGAELRSGAEEIAARSGLDAAIAAADLVITGEGRFDSQSASGKIPHHIATLAADVGVASSLIAGLIEAPTDQFSDAVSLSDLAGSGATARAGAEHWLEVAGATLAGRFGQS